MSVRTKLSIIIVLMIVVGAASGFLAKDMGMTALGGGVAALVVLGIVALSITGSMAKTVAAIQGAVDGMAAGRFDEVPVHSSDEFGAIAKSLNSSLGWFKGYYQTETERKATQENVIKFLDVVSQAADGDLSVKAPVTADVFGNIADAYNIMMESLSNLMTDVRKSADELGRESRRLLKIFNELEQGAETQMSQVKKATTFVNETSTATTNISQKATQAQDLSATVDKATSQGDELVKKNIEGMQLIRVTVQAINKKMKSLSERLMEIGTISQLISEVSSRTTILAMNASIEAARAGAQGRGFLVIADEIKGLADKSAEATKQINGIIRAIQTEASEVTASLEDETRTVEAQTKLAQDTGEAFKEIEQSVSGTRHVVSEIYDVSQRQRQISNEVVISMDEVSKISVHALSLVKNSAQISEGMNTMSENLLKSLSRFRLEGGA